MRITYIGNCRLDGTRANQVQILNMCAALQRRGCSVELFCDPVNQDREALAALFGLSSVPRVRSLPVCSLKGYSLLLAPLSAVRAIRSHPDVIYTRDVRAAAWVARLGHDVVYEAHAVPRAGVSAVAFRWLRRSVRLKGVVAISEALGRALDTPAPILVAHDGADLSTLAPELEYWPIGQRIRVGYIGSGYQGKGADFVARLAQYRPDVDFEVVGPTEAEMLPDGSSVPGNLTIVARVPAAQVADRLQTYDVLVAPYARAVTSAGGQEISRWMSPLKIFEYMAAARPMIASDLPVLREVLHDGYNGLLCEPGEVEDWSTALDRLIADPAMAVRIANKARDDVRDSYSWDARANAVRKFVEKIHRGAVPFAQ